MSRHLVSRLYVGADNGSGRLNSVKLTEVCRKQFNAFTVTPSWGVWNGEWEDCYVVTIAQGRPDQRQTGHTEELDWKLAHVRIEDLAQNLARELKQECVMVENTWADVEFVGAQEDRK